MASTRTMTRSKRTRTRATSTNNKKDDNTISILKRICKSNCIQLPPAANDRGGTTSIGAIACNIYHQLLSPNKWITHRAGGDKADWVFIPCSLIDKHTVAEIKRNGQSDVHYFYGWEKLRRLLLLMIVVRRRRRMRTRRLWMLLVDLLVGREVEQQHMMIRTTTTTTHQQQQQ